MDAAVVPPASAVRYTALPSRGVVARICGLDRPAARASKRTGTCGVDSHPAASSHGGLAVGMYQDDHVICLAIAYKGPVDNDGRPLSPSKCNINKRRQNQGRINASRLRLPKLQRKRFSLFSWLHILSSTPFPLFPFFVLSALFFSFSFFTR